MIYLYYIQVEMSLAVSWQTLPHPQWALGQRKIILMEIALFEIKKLLVFCKVALRTIILPDNIIRKHCEQLIT